MTFCIVVFAAFTAKNSRGDTNAAVDVNGKGDVFENQVFQLRGFQRQEQSGLLAGVGIDFSAGQPDIDIAELVPLPKIRPLNCSAGKIVFAGKIQIAFDDVAVKLPTGSRLSGKTIAVALSEIFHVTHTQVIAFDKFQVDNPLGGIFDVVVDAVLMI